MDNVNLYGWRENISWDKVRIYNKGHLLVETQATTNITNYSLETTQLDVLSNITSTKNNTNDIAINTNAIGLDTTSMIQN